MAVAAQTITVTMLEANGADIAAAQAAGVGEPLDGSGVPTAAARDAAARALRLERLDADRVLEWHLVR